MGIRSQIQNRNRFVSEPAGMGVNRFVWICLVSAGIHVLFFGLLLFFHNFDFRPPAPRVVRVDLVSFVPGPVGGVKTPAREMAKEPAPVAKKADVNVNQAPPTPKPAAPEAPAPVAVIKPDISLKSKPKDIKELMAAREKKDPPKPEKVEEKKDVPKPEKAEDKKPKPKKEPDPEKTLEKAREEMAKKVEAQDQEQINEALERMKAAIASRQSDAGATEGDGEGTGPGRKASDPILLYQSLLQAAIEQNWVFNDLLARMNKNLQCRVLIKILPDGTVRDVIYTTRSGNAYLDESAKKAILRSSPLPPLPRGMTSYDIELVFSPEGL